MAAWWVALAALWLGLDDTVAFPELMTGAAAALIGAVAAELVHSQNLVRLRIKPGWLRHAWRPLLQLLPDTVRVMAVLFRQLVLRRPPRGEFRAVRFHPGRPDDAEDTARRVLAKALGSFAPNSYVIGVDDERDIMLVHQLEPRGGAEKLDPLELG